MAAGLILFEDEHLLVIHKPAGINTHKPDRFAPDGISEWLNKRGRQLTIHQRLDKETSGVLVFGKSARASQSLARQFESHQVRKEYLLLTTAKPTRKKFRAEIGREVTEFEYIQPHGEAHLIVARPITGKTHQIRRHAAANGFPILGDTKYEGAPAARLMLHAHRIALEEGNFEASVPRAFDEPDRLVVAQDCRELLFDDDTNAYRLLADEDVIVDWYDGHALVQWQTEKTGELKLEAKTVHEQIVTRQRRTPPVGPPVQRFPILENGLTYLINFGEGLASGLFLDQRENRRRLLTGKLAGKRVLNCFAYTCAFSVAAAKAGALTTSVDLSRKYLDWGKDNFRANDLDPAGHDFIFGDVFEWLKRFAKRGQTWDVVLLDPPTFSTTKKGRAFRAERDYLELAKLAATLVTPGGTLFCSTNQRGFAPEEFERTIRQCGRTIKALEYETVPFDFLPADYLKTLWATLE
jgi:23S rRNA (cytosine1962-C5)-methyltransferase